MSKFQLAIFASGNGTNAERLFQHFSKRDEIEVVLLLSNNPEAFVLKRAEKAGVPAKIFSKTQFKESEVLEWLRSYEVTHIVLAGFLWLIPKNILNAYSDRIINIHPALLPKYGGKGMYGLKVHEAVKTSKEADTGITIHLVNEHYDNGKIIFQAKTLIDPDDSPEQIAEKVHQLEYQHYPVVVENWILKGKV